MEHILSEVRDRVAEGAREIMLLGQTVNSYHREGAGGPDTDFADLLAAVAGVDGVDRVRFISPHPYYMSDRVIEAMAGVPQVCASVHLPVQSGSNTVLKRMLRNYTREHYLNLVGKMRDAMPDMTISTDIIVGFPGETEDDFRRTLSLIEEAAFDWGFIFKYSSREGTPAAEWEGFPESLIEERHRECLELVERLAMRKRLVLAGTRQEVLIEEGNVGRTRTNYKVQVEGNVVPGQMVPVRIGDTQRPTLEGKVD
jgi:tRNA-2-methylthio-N6-dimethylallyladenosine synthase